MAPGPKGKILITGAAGFVGSRLLTALRADGYEAHGASFDLTDFAGTEEAIRGNSWDSVVHLAAISHVPTCEKDPALAYKTNVAGTALLLEALRRHSPSTRVVFSSTAQVYQAPTDQERGKPIVMDEARPVVPQNTYARSKWQAELLLQDAARQAGIPVTILRLFNHTHKSQSPDFFLPHLYHSLLKVRESAAPGAPISIPVGNLELSRDIGSIHDLLTAFAAVIGRAPTRTGAAKAEAEIFNVCSGTPKRLSKLAKELSARLGLPHTQFVVEASRIRPGEPETIQGSHGRLTEATGWRPHCVDERQLLDRFLEE